MPYAVELIFDKITENKVRNLWKKCFDAGASGYFVNGNSVPHISLAVYDDVNESQILPKLETFSKTVKKFEVSLNQFKVFSNLLSTIYLEPVPNETLKNIHSEYLNLFSSFSQTLSTYYSLENWVPHCSLAMEVEQEMVQPLLNTLSTELLPFTGTIEKIGIVKFKPSTLLVDFDLN